MIFICDKKFWSFLSTLANIWKFSVTEASSALLHFSYFFWIDYFKNRYIISFFISGSVNHLLLVVNSSMNFLIYCCMAKRFRKALLDVFRSWRCHWSGGSILQCWMPFDDLSKMDVNRYNWKIHAFSPLSVQTTKHFMGII